MENIVKLIEKAPAPKTAGRQWRDAHQFIAALERRGFKTRGAGAFSTVMAKRGSNRVVKINRSMDDWPSYIVWANKAGFGGTLAPKLFSYREIEATSGGKFYVAVVERFEMTVWNFSGHEYGHPKARHQETLRIAMGSRYRSYDAAALSPEEKRFAAAFNERFKDCNMDLHADNFMVRADGSLVCTDPLSSTNHPTPYKRLRSRDIASLRFALPECLRIME